MHVGPTNSGKTYGALTALRNAKSGVYCAPLRLLAHEVHEKMNEEHGINCDLITGQVRIEDDYAKHVSCTIGMLLCLFASLIGFVLMMFVLSWS